MEVTDEEAAIIAEALDFHGERLRADAKFSTNLIAKNKLIEKSDVCFVLAHRVTHDTRSNSNGSSE